MIILTLALRASFSDEKEEDADDGKKNPFTPTSESNKGKKSKTPVLDNFGKDITALADKIN